MRVLSRERRDWTCPIVRFVNLISFKFEPDLETVTTLELNYRQRVLECFVEACYHTLKLVEEVEPRLYSLQAYVVRQYYVAVCQKFFAAESDIERAECTHRLHSTLARSIPQKYLDASDAERTLRHWIAMNIFHPILAALASTWQEKDRSFLEHIKSFNEGGPWIDAVETFLPSAVTLDYFSFIVGTTFMHWMKDHRLNELEKRVRDATFPRKLRRRFRKARRLLGLCIIYTKGWSWDVTEEKGRAALEAQFAPGPFTAYGTDKYLSLFGPGNENGMQRGFWEIEPCATCRIWFCSKSKCTEAPHKPLGVNWDPKRGWQCGESDAYSQKYSYDLYKKRAGTVESFALKKRRVRDGRR